MITTNIGMPIYSLGDNGVALQLLEAIPFLGSKPYRWKQVPQHELLHRFRFAQGQNSSEVCFLLAVLVLFGSEAGQRELIRRKSNPKLRSIKLGGKTVPVFLRDVLEPDWRYTSKNRGGEEMKNEKEFDKILSETLGPIKNALGLREVNPVVNSYPVKASVIASAADPACRFFLESLATEGPVYSGVIVSLCEKLRVEFPADAESVIQSLKAGETREHLSAISFTAKGRESRITIVNPKGDLLKMDALKFEALIQGCDTTKLLGVLGSKWNDNGVVAVEFTTPLSTGEVVARYDSQISMLHVANLKESDREIGYSTVFVLDADTVTCFYLAIRRQRLDRQRFERLLDEAETKLEVDPFRHLI